MEGNCSYKEVLKRVALIVKSLWQKYSPPPPFQK